MDTENTPKIRQVRERPTQEQHRSVKLDYVQGKGSVRQCAARHSVCFQTANAWSRDEKWTALRRKFAEKANATLFDFDSKIRSTTEQKQTPESAKPTTSNDKLSKVEKQLETIDKMIEEVYDVKELTSLLQAKERLLDMWSLLTGFPKPGVRKTTKRGIVGIGVAPDGSVAAPMPEPTPLK